MRLAKGTGTTAAEFRHVHLAVFGGQLGQGVGIGGRVLGHAVVGEVARRVDLARAAAFEFTKKVNPVRLHRHIVHFVLLRTWSNTAPFRHFVESTSGLSYTAK